MLPWKEAKCHNPSQGCNIRGKESSLCRMKYRQTLNQVKQEDDLNQSPHKFITTAALAAPLVKRRKSLRRKSIVNQCTVSWNPGLDKSWSWPGFLYWPRQFKMGIPAWVVLLQWKNTLLQNNQLRTKAVKSLKDNCTRVEFTSRHKTDGKFLVMLIHVSLLLDTFHKS